MTPLSTPDTTANGRPVSSIRDEKRSNPRIGNGRTREEFIAIMKNLRLDPPSSLHETLPLNLRNGITGAEPLTA